MLSSLLPDILNPNKDSNFDAVNGPGYASPAEACKGPREKYLFITCPSSEPEKAPDAIVSIDVDPNSETYGQAVSKLMMPNLGDEIHHMGWNICSSCHGCKDAKRSHLIITCLLSSRIYIVNAEDPRNLILTKTIEGETLKKFDVHFPHTIHCTKNHIMISTLGDANDNNKCDFLLIDNKTFEPTGTWVKGDINKDNKLFCYDFWYQPYHKVLISSEWGAPKCVRDKFKPTDVALGYYGHKINIFDFPDGTLRQTITFEGDEGWCPFEMRFKHDPKDRNAFILTALGSALYHVYKDSDEDIEWKHRVAVSIPSKTVKNWILPTMPSMPTDLVISMDDNYLFMSNWAHGDIRMYNIRDPFSIKLVGRVFVGGSIHKESGVIVEEDSELVGQPDATYVKGIKIEGGPHRLMLSLDGKRLYVTNQLFSPWERQFYPQNFISGGKLIQIDVDTEEKSTAANRMKINQDFLVDFGTLFDNGIPYFAHEMRYPGGDVVSDIFLVPEKEGSCCDKRDCD
jgi:selenium-binding protein 1